MKKRIEDIISYGSLFRDTGKEKTGISRFLVFFLSLLPFFAVSGQNPVCPPSSLNYSFKKGITLNGASISGTNNNFPVLIDITDADLKKDVKSPNGFDIIFTDLSYNVLNHDLESWDPLTGHLVVWVQVPQITAGSDYTFYMLYGKSGILTDQSTSATWDPGYAGVWHFTSGYGDATAYGNTGLNVNTTLNGGKIAGATYFNNPTDRITVSTDHLSTATGTVEAWVNTAGVAGTDPDYIFGHLKTFGEDKIELYLEYSSDNYAQYLNVGLGTYHPIYTANNDFQNGSWNHVVLVWNNSVFYQYINDKLIYSNTGVGITGFTGFADIGNDGNLPTRNKGWNGHIDEVRLSNVARSGDWILTEFNNQNSMETFIKSISAPIQYPAPVISGPAKACPGSSGITYTTPLVENHTYQWTVTGSASYSGSDSQTLTVNWPADCNLAATVSVTETDVITLCTGTAVLDVNISDDQDPVVTSAAGSLDRSLSCNDAAGLTAALALVPAVTDNCTLVPGIFTFDDNTASAPGCPGSYIRTRSWVFEDACGRKSAPFVQTITVTDLIKPVISTVAGALDATLQCSDQAGIDAAIAALPAATDECSPLTEIQLISDVTTPDGGCTNGYERVRKWNFIDGCGNTSDTYTQTIKVTDTTVPVISTPGGSLDAVIACTDAAGLAAALDLVPVATDNCSATTLHLTDDKTTPDPVCPGAYVRVRKWNFTDACGNTSSTFIQTINVVDTEKPVISTPAGSLDVTLQCLDGPGTTAALALHPSAVDNCSPSTIMTVESDITTPDPLCPNAYVRVRKWNFADGCGNVSDDFTQTITVIDNTKPVVVTLPGALNGTVECSDTDGLTALLNLIPVATDNCSSETKIRLTDDVTLNASGCPEGYTRTRTWVFSDGCGNDSDPYSQIITVTDTKVPVITTPAGSLDRTVSCSDATAISAALSLLPQATDNCSVGLIQTPLSDITTPDGSCPGAYKRVRSWNFTDACGNTSSTFVQTITVVDNIKPVVSTPAGALDGTYECSDTPGIAAALALKPAATDNCTVSLIASLISDVKVADPLCANAWVRTRIWTFSDGCGNTSDQYIQTIKVVDDAPPVLITIVGSLDASLECSDKAGLAAALALVPLAADNCTALPLINLVSDVTTPDPSCLNAYVRTRTWNFTDGCGNTSDNFVQNIRVNDSTNPVIVSLPGSLDATLQCSDTEGIAAAVAASPQATDNCTLLPDLHLISDVTTIDPACGHAYVRVRIWKFTDGCGNTSSQFEQKISVIDNTSPVINDLPGSLDATLSCSDIAGINAAIAAKPSATDNCTSNVIITLVSDNTTVDASCPNAYVRIRKWRFADVCGNTTPEFTQTIRVIDNTKPVIQTASGALDAFLECSDAAAISAAVAKVPTASDNCSVSPSIHLISDVTTPDPLCQHGYTRVRKWNFTDDCGNVSDIFVQTITVSDNIKPSFVTLPGALDVVLQCSDISGIAAAVAAHPVAVDNCTALPVIKLLSDVSTADPSCSSGYVRVRKWTFSDECGNESEIFTQTITVVDKIKPIVTTVAGSLDATLQCSDPDGISAALALKPVATDNCTTPVLHLVSDLTTNNVSCANEYTRVRIWTFTDDCGNTSDPFVQTITVIDNTKPTLLTLAASLDATLQCSDAAGIALALTKVPLAADNCDDSPVLHLVSDKITPDAACANAYKRVRTWNFTDACGNISDPFIQTITVIDNTKPVIKTIAGSFDVTLQCSDPGGLNEALSRFPAATDNCTSAPVRNLVSDITTPDASCPGAYIRVRVWNFTDGCGNTSDNFIQTITVVDNTPPAFTVPADITICRNSDCSYDTSVSVTGDVTDETDNCSPALQAVFTDQLFGLDDCNKAGYIVRSWTLTDLCGNSTLRNQKIKVEPLPSATITNNNPVICNGSEVTLLIDSPTESTDPAYLSYDIIVSSSDPASTGGTASGNLTLAKTNLPFTLDGILTNSSNAPVKVTFTVTSRLSNCSAVTSTTTEVIVNPSAVMAHVTGQTICNGTATSPVSFSSLNTGGTASYSWMNDIPAIGLPASGTGPLASFVASNDGDAYITANIKVMPIFTNGGVTCTGTEKIFGITVNPTPRALPLNPNLMADTSICFSGTTAINLTSPTVLTSGNVIFDYSVAVSDPLITGNTNPESSLPQGYTISRNYQNALNTTGSVYFTIVPRVDNGICAPGKPVVAEIKVHPRVINYSRAGTGGDGIEIVRPLTCEGGSNASLRVHTSEGTGPFYVLWERSSTIKQEGTDLTYVENLIGGGWQVTVTDALGCSSTSFKDIAGGASFNTYFNAFKNVTCPGGSDGAIALMENGSGNLVYTYEIHRLYEGNESVVINGTIDAKGKYYYFNDMLPGSYKLLMWDANGCANVNYLHPNAPLETVTQPDSITSDIVSVNETCHSNDGTITINSVSGGTPGYSYAWYYDPQLLNPAGNLTGANLTGLKAATYYLSITDSKGCRKTESVVVDPPAPVIFEAVPADRNGFEISCSGYSDGIINLTPLSGTAPYNFTVKKPDATEISSPTGPFTGLRSGKYLISVIDKNFCTALDSVILTEPGKLNINLELSLSSFGGYNVNCNGDQTASIDVSTVNGVGTVVYRWEDGFIGSTRTNLSAGGYRVIVEDANHCSADTLISVTEPAPFILSFTEMELPFCPDKPDGSLTVEATGGVQGSGYVYLWDNGSTSESISDLGSGYYKVTARDINGCVTADSVDLKAKNPVCLVIPNAISPNGDLINDVWNIGEISLYPGVEVKIFNRNGQLLWTSEKGYPHPWDGTANGRSLPIDSYHYIIDLHNGTRPFIGNVTIIK